MAATKRDTAPIPPQNSLDHVGLLSGAFQKVHLAVYLIAHSCQLFLYLGHIFHIVYKDLCAVVNQFI